LCRQRRHAIYRAAAEPVWTSSDPMCRRHACTNETDDSRGARTASERLARSDDVHQFAQLPAPGIRTRARYTADPEAKYKVRPSLSPQATFDAPGRITSSALPSGEMTQVPGPVLANTFPSRSTFRPSAPIRAKIRPFASVPSRLTSYLKMTGFLESVQSA